MRRILYVTLQGCLCILCMYFYFVSVGCGRGALEPGDCPTDCEYINLTDFWRNASDGVKGLTVFKIVEGGLSVTSTREEPLVCNVEGNISETTKDFVGTFIDICTIEGQITFCRFCERGSCDPKVLGLVDLDFEANISCDQNVIEAEWTDPVFGLSGSARWERLGCQPKSPYDYIPGAGNIEFTTEHDLALGQIDYYSDVVFGEDHTQDVVAGVNGVVAGRGREEDDPFVIVEVLNGNRIEYQFFGSYPPGFQPGDPIDPGTVIGTIREVPDQPVPNSLWLQLKAYDPDTDDPINPDCVED